ncbi:MAG: hypothetical protein WBF34_27685 [Streptosporangiaceae bacterium]
MSSAPGVARSPGPRAQGLALSVSALQGSLAARSAVGGVIYDARDRAARSG